MFQYFNKPVLRDTWRKTTWLSYTFYRIENALKENEIPLVKVIQV